MLRPDDAVGLPSLRVWERSPVSVGAAGYCVMSWQRTDASDPEFVWSFDDGAIHGRPLRRVVTTFFPDDTSRQTLWSFADGTVLGSVV